MCGVLEDGVSLSDGQLVDAGRASMGVGEKRQMPWPEGVGALMMRFPVEKSGEPRETAGSDDGGVGNDGRSRCDSSDGGFGRSSITERI